MKLEQELQQRYAMRVWRYISKPFQITKVLEILYTLDWIWYAVLSLLPPADTSGSLFIAARIFMPPFAVSLLMITIAVLQSMALLRNMVWLRKINILFNVFILCYLAFSLLLQTPISSGAGYLIILIGVSIFAFLRMDENL
jgi:hypothetical protein